MEAIVSGVDFGVVCAEALFLEFVQLPRHPALTPLAKRRLPRPERTRLQGSSRLAARADDLNVAARYPCLAEHAHSVRRASGGDVTLAAVPAIFEMELRAARDSEIESLGQHDSRDELPGDTECPGSICLRRHSPLPEEMQKPVSRRFLQRFAHDLSLPHVTRHALGS